MEPVIIAHFPTYRIYKDGRVESYSAGPGIKGSDWRWRPLVHGKSLCGGNRKVKFPYPFVRLKNHVTGKVHNRMVHRLLWEAFVGPIPLGVQIDHINHDTLDFRLENLRLSSHAENQRNRKNPEGTTGFRGVYRRKDCDRYSAHIMYNNKSIHIGLYKTGEEAAKARDRKAIELFGEFAKLNFPKNNHVISRI